MAQPFACDSRKSFGYFACLLLFVICLAALALAIVAAEDADDRQPIRALGDLNGKRLGVIAGTMLDVAVNDTLDFTDITYFENTEAELEALFAGEIDAIIDDQPVARHLAGTTPGLRLLPGVFIEDNYAFAMRLDDTALHADVNQALRELLGDGTMKKLEERWLDSQDDSLRVMPEPPERTGGGVLRLGLSPVSAPFAYTDAEGRLIGLDLELMQLVAQRVNRRLVVVNLDFSSLIPSLLAGEVDVIGSCLSITPDRQKIVRFTDSYFHGGVAALVLAPEQVRLQK